MMRKAVRPKKRWFLCLLLLFTFVLSLVETLLYEPVFTSQRLSDTVLFIDAGHGGEDGGASSADGLKESDINLSIALKLDALCGFYGIETVLTRDSDVSIHSEDAQSISQKKVSDLHNRVAMISEVTNAKLISIHQNAFPQTEYHGLQVFYGEEEDAVWANTLQALVKEHVDAYNMRVPQEASDSIYLMANLSCPRILVECGFLSNPEEAALLATDTYQTKLAIMMLGSV